MGYIFEESYGQRSTILLLLTSCFIILMLVNLLQKKGPLATTLLSALMVFLLITIEFYSKYALNYFYHTLYILLIFFNIVQIASSAAIWIGALITALSFVKFIQLIMIERTFSNIALMVFFGSVQILVVVIGLFLKVYQEESNKTKALYDELLKTHDQLTVYAEEIKELTQVEARTLIARDLHDTLGHELTGLIMQMEMASSYYEKGLIEEGQPLLEASKKSARESLVKVRKIVETLKSNEGLSTTRDSIESLINSFSAKTGCDIQFTHKGTHQLRPAKSIVLYRIVQEALTNSVRHGRATHIEVVLIYGSDQVSFDIEDNGIGCKEISENNGLSGMKERIKEVNGHIEITGLPSFRIWGTIPYGEV